MSYLSFRIITKGRKWVWPRASNFRSQRVRAVILECCTIFKPLPPRPLKVCLVSQPQWRVHSGLSWHMQLSGSYRDLGPWASVLVGSPHSLHSLLFPAEQAPPLLRELNNLPKAGITSSTLDSLFLTADGVNILLIFYCQVPVNINAKGMKSMGTIMHISNYILLSLVSV